MVHPTWAGTFVLAGVSCHLSHLEGEQPYLRDLLAMIFNHLLNGTILQVHVLLLKDDACFLKTFTQNLGLQNVSDLKNPSVQTLGIKTLMF